MCQLITCAKCCSIFSIIGFIFLIIIGSLLQSQPLYMKGATSPADSATSCYYGALIYAITAIISIAYWFFYESYQSGRRYFTSTGTSNTNGNETIKFGTRYGAVVTTGAH